MWTWVVDMATNVYIYINKLKWHFLLVYSDTCVKSSGVSTDQINMLAKLEPSEE